MMMNEATVTPGGPFDLCGRWAGQWASSKSGRSGPLKARFRKLDDVHYHVTFRGRFWTVFPFRYSVTLDVTGHDGERIFLAGQRRLLFFGTFKYEAEATATDFRASYTARKDHGHFALTRPG